MFTPAIQLCGWKRALDIGVIVLSLPVVLPLMVLITAVIRIVSAGPVIFQQERVGYLGRRFMCLKFRTMLVGADTSVHQGHLSRLMRADVPMEKMDEQGDPRVIPFGSLLRASGLDELPQVINVLRGEMSLVGPRPCMPYEYNNYQPWQIERFNTMPGLTGLWQVSGKNRTTFDEMVQLDIRYVRNKSPWLDLKIMLKTIPALMVQMLETRRKKQSLARPAQPESVVTAQAGNERSVPEQCSAR